MTLRLDLTDLRLFVNIVDAGSITAGAKATHMTLASASARVIGLEEALDSRLLLRNRRGVQANAAGQVLLQHARAVLRQAEELRADIATWAQRHDGLVRLTGNSAAVREYVPDALGDFLVAHPQANVVLEEAVPAAAVDTVLAGDADLGIVAEPVDLRGLQALPLGPTAFALVTPRGHALAAAARVRTVTMHDADACDVVGLLEGSALQETWAERAVQRGSRLNYRVRVASFDAQARLVERGVGISLMPETAARRLARTWAVEVIPLQDTLLRGRLLLCARDWAALPALAMVLAQRLRAG